MRIKIDTHKIGLKQPISIIVNLKSADKVDEMSDKITRFQIEAMEVDQASKEHPDDLETVQKSLEVSKGLRKLSQECIDFLKQTLKLDAKQVQTMRRTLPSRNALMSYTGYVCGRMQYPDVDLTQGDQPTKDEKPQQPISEDSSKKSK